ncbi:hypothetical protein ACIOK4_08030 [Streptomyces bottropensis]|uniref:hypothetical protein n=1 Tax=Streptomyces bottropensis TaxID=42235 RepID=UPI0036C1A182
MQVELGRGGSQSGGRHLGDAPGNLGVDPWDLYLGYWPLLRAKLRREKSEFSWSINLNNVFSRLFRLAWGTAAAVAAVLRSCGWAPSVATARRWWM